MPNIVRLPVEAHRSSEPSFYLGYRALSSSNPWTQYVDTSSPTDERWIATLNIVGQAGAAADDFEALIRRVRGASGFLSVFNPSRRWPRGTATGLVKGATTRFDDGTTFDDGSEFQDGIASCVVAAAAQRGANYVRLAGLIPDQAVGFATGDMLSISVFSTDTGYLHAVDASAPTNASGQATVRISPALRAPISPGAFVRLKDPRGVFRIADAENVGGPREFAGQIIRPQLSLVEVPEVFTCAL